jgi:hypothetical protein
LTFNPGFVTYGFGAYNHIVELSASFFQWNDFIGQTIYASPGLSSIRILPHSVEISPNTFVGTFASFLPPFGSGTAYVGFRLGGNVGWFSMNLGGGVNGITYLDGQYGTEGESVHVGKKIPEPTGIAALAMLALGAVGVRRNRKK